MFLLSGTQENNDLLYIQTYAVTGLTMVNWHREIIYWDPKKLCFDFLENQTEEEKKWGPVKTRKISHPLSPRIMTLRSIRLREAIFGNQKATASISAENWEFRKSVSGRTKRNWSLSVVFLFQNSEIGKV